MIDPETKQARRDAWLIFEPLWKAGILSRDETHDRLASYIGVESVSIDQLTARQCARVNDFVTDIFCGPDLIRFGERRAVGLLDKVAPAKKQRPPRIILTGTPKIGKSTFAAGFSSPIFLPIDKEEGIDDVDADAFPVSKSFDDVRSYIVALAEEEHEYKTVVVDSVSTLSPLVMQKAMQVEGVAEEQKLGGGYGREHNTAIELWMKLLTGIDRLRDRGMTSILIGHVKKSSFEDPIAGSYSQYITDLPKKIVEPINRWADCILFANWEVYRKSEDVGFGKEQHRAVGAGERIVHTQERPSHPGGGRGVYGRLPYKLPFTAEAFKDAVREQMSKESEAK